VVSLLVVGVVEVVTLRVVVLLLGAVVVGVLTLTLVVPLVVSVVVDSVSGSKVVVTVDVAEGVCADVVVRLASMPLSV